MRSRSALNLLSIGLLLGACGSDGSGGGDGGSSPDAAQSTGDCAVLNHRPVTASTIADIAVTADADAGNGLSLYYRRSNVTEYTELAMTGEAQTFTATIPSSALSFAGMDYYILARGAGCELTHPPSEPASSPHAIEIYGEYNVTPATGVYNYLPSVFGNQVVWADEEANQGDDVFRFDLDTMEMMAITEHPRAQGAAVIWGENVVWVDARNRSGDINVDIYGAHLSAPADAFQVTTNTDDQYGVAISGHIIVWRDDRDSGTGKGNIYFYDMGPDGRFGSGDDRGESQLTSDPSDQTAADVSVDADGRVRIVWQDMRDDADGICDANCNVNVYLYDFGPDAIFDSGDDIGPTRITTDLLEQRSPAISENRIVWRDARGGNWLDPDIYSYDLGVDGLFGTPDDGGESLVDVPTVAPKNLDLSGEKLVFQDDRNGNLDIWLYDFASGAESPITTDPNGQFYPRIHGDTIVWQDTRNNPDTGNPFDDSLDDIYVHVLRKADQ